MLECCFWEGYAVFLAEVLDCAWWEEMGCRLATECAECVGFGFAPFAEGGEADACGCG